MLNITVQKLAEIVRDVVGQAPSGGKNSPVLDIEKVNTLLEPMESPIQFNQR
jgi:hypothetical protein